MRIFFALTLIVSASALAADPRAKLTRNGDYSDRAAAWDKLKVLDIKLGQPLESQPGFTCGPPPGTDGFSTQNHSCVKFLDAKCKGRPAKIHHLHSNGDVPKGQSCFMDEFNGQTYLDRQIASLPLSAVRIVGTDTTKPLIMSIEYTFAADDVKEDSNLGKALIAKYGPPTSKNEPIGMYWQMGNVVLRVDCRVIQTPNGEFCKLVAEDQGIDQTERELQEQANEDIKKKNAPAAPKL
jgi:hypothetical protein